MIGVVGLAAIWGAYQYPSNSRFPLIQPSNARVEDVDLETLEGDYRGRLRWWLDTGWTRSAWSLPVQLTVAREGAANLTATLVIRRPVGSLLNAGPLVGDVLAQAETPASRLVEAPTSITVPVMVHQLEGQRLTLQFSYEDPYTWLDIDARAVLRIIWEAKGAGGPRLTGTVEGRAYSKRVQGVLDLEQQGEEEVGATGKGGANPNQGQE